MRAVAVVGAGFSGAVIARELALAGCAVDVFETRDHVAGNCHSSRDAATGIMVHTYGPHIFHTSNVEVWNYVRQFDEFMPFTNRVKAVSGARVYSLPINLLTINQFFGRTFSPHEAKEFINANADATIADPVTFEDQALRFVGRSLYDAFLKGYTRKQWGADPTELPASILKRMPVRFNYDDNYYDSQYQGMPKHGYCRLVERVLDVPGVALHLSTPFDRAFSSEYDHVFCSGTIDSWFDWCEGALGYRTLDFEVERHDGDYQGNAVINYPDEAVPFTRISEHKHFAPWENHAQTIIYKEYSRECHEGDTPYYPLRLAADMERLLRYEALARGEGNVTFVGRLGTYRYIDMHVTIAEALGVARAFVRSLNATTALPMLA